jgi:hypothetical protein
MTENDTCAGDTDHPHEGRDCPYCDDGTLSQINDWANPMECSNGGDCPATFVAIFGGGSAATGGDSA